MRLAHIWKEFQNPKLKCKRVGHVKNRVSFPAYVKTDYSGVGRGVVSSATITQTLCKRCGTRLSRNHISNRESIHSLTMPTSMWDQLKARGYVRKGY